MSDQIETYAGESASAEKLLQLAEEYRRAAEALQKLGRHGRPLSRHPYRLAANHAIELYLSAFLMAAGLSSEDIRELGHDLAKRAEKAQTSGLTLRMRTEARLAELVEQREYLVSRYGTDQTISLSQINRLAATLIEIEKKVVKKVRTRLVYGKQGLDKQRIRTFVL